MPSNEQDNALEQINSESTKHINNIETHKYDETGAQKEILFHKELSSIIDTYIEFDENGKAQLKPGGENITIIGVTSRDLKRANKEGGHFGGDRLLRQTVETTKKLLGTAEIDSASIYHMYSSDFLVIANTPHEKSNYFIDESNLLGVPFSKDAKPGRITSTRVDLSEVIDFYNQYQELSQASSEQNAYAFKKTIAGQAIKLISFRQEQQKLLDTYTDLLERKNQGEDVEAYYSMYGSALFRSQGIENFAELEQIENNGKLFFKIAFDRVYGEGNIPLYIWTQLKDKIAEYNQASVLFQSEAIDISASIESRFSKPAKSEKDLDIEENFQTERFVYRTTYGRMINYLNEHINLLPQDANNISVIEAEDYLSVAVTLYKYYTKEGKDIEAWEEIVKSVRQAYTKIDEIERRKSFGQTRSSDWVENMYVTRLNKFRELAKNTLDDIKMERDTLTGLPNKDVFNADLAQTITQETHGNEFGIVSIDMGFLQYFNNIGSPDRKVGDLAISKTAYILESVIEELDRKGIKAKAYRTGGDEFNIIIIGGKDRITEATELIYEKNLEQNPTVETPNGLVPNAPNTKASYVPRMLQFDTGYVHSSDGKEVLLQILNGEQSANTFSEDDTKLLTTIIETNDISQLSESQVEMYTSTLGEIMKRTADKLIEDNKRHLRFRLLLQICRNY